MIVVPSDEPKGSSQSTIISTLYCLPPQASAYSTSTTVFSVPTEHHLPTTVVHPADNPLLWNNKPAANFLSLDVDPTLDPAYVAEVEAERVTAKRSRICTNQLKRWLPDWDLYLADFLHLEGCGDHPDVCPRHQHTGELHHASYCCIDCSGGELLCQGCMVSTHMYNPLHQIEVTLLTILAQSLTRSMTCRCPHQRSSQSCSRLLKLPAGKAPHPSTPSLSMVPASVNCPCTAATLAVLRQFQILSFESKASAFEFYNSLKCLTENTGVSPPKDRYRL
ncbi:hypothetical protein B0H34DRAFT_734175, partial [Crassisporium funariophilum]